MKIVEYQLNDENKEKLVRELTKYYINNKGESLLDYINKNKVGNFVLKLLNPDNLLMSENEYTARKRVEFHEENNHEFYQVVSRNEAYAMFTLLKGTEYGQSYIHIPEIILVKDVLSYDESENIYNDIVKFTNELAYDLEIDFISIEAYNLKRDVYEKLLADGYLPEEDNSNVIEEASSYKKQIKRM